MTATVVTKDGFIEHRSHRVWWGTAGSDELEGVPLLTVHGGPGMPHDCLEPLAALAGRRQVVFYDQYGCGRSDRATDPAEYDVDVFVDEVDEIRTALNLGPVHLFAHSYGGPIALEYLLTRPHDDVLSLTISNSFYNVAALASGWTRRLAELPTELAQVLLSGGEGDPEAYGAAVSTFWERFVFPFPHPEPLRRSQTHSGAEVYVRMHGSSWFVPDGVWSTWDAGPRLHEIDVPTLVIAGTRDQCVPELSETIAERVPDSQLHVLDTAHLPFFERPDEFLDLVQIFLADVEGRSDRSPVLG